MLSSAPGWNLVIAFNSARLEPGLVRAAHNYSAYLLAFISARLEPGLVIAAHNSSACFAETWSSTCSAQLFSLFCWKAMIILASRPDFWKNCRISFSFYQFTFFCAAVAALLVLSILCPQSWRQSDDNPKVLPVQGPVHGTIHRPVKV
jgi:hypothetical protein